MTDFAFFLKLNRPILFFLSILFLLSVSESCMAQPQITYNTTNKKIILCGIPGSGKTTIATKFAKAGYCVVDMDKEEEKSRAKRADEICLLLSKHGDAAKCNKTNYLKKLKECGNSLSNTIEAMLIEQGVNKEKTKETAQLIWLKSTQQFVIEKMQNHISHQPTVFDFGARQILVLTSTILQQENLSTILLDTSIDTATKRLFEINKQTNMYDFLKRTNMRLLVAEKLHLLQDQKWKPLNKEQQDKLINQEMKNGKKLQLAKDAIKIILQERVEQYEFFKQKMQNYIITIDTNEKSIEEIFVTINEKLFL